VESKWNLHSTFSPKVECGPLVDLSRDDHTLVVTPGLIPSGMGLHQPVTIVDRMGCFADIPYGRSPIILRIRSSILRPTPPSA